ncbi:S8 family serine peptidase [Streptomyces sp. NPDC014724]|uniref:S8 family serine peptidase n=1 Tax=unclassified Streptomyces TaxID=2593676 RepID=UPI0036F8541E
MSLGSSMPSDGTDPMSQAVNRLTEDSGALFVVAAGNYAAETAIGGPGAADEALTVAAVDSADKRASFSSMGPRYNDYALKPDISAPGVGVLAAKAGGSAATAGRGLGAPRSRLLTATRLSGRWILSVSRRQATPTDASNSPHEVPIAVAHPSAAGTNPDA